MLLISLKATGSETESESASKEPSKSQTSIARASVLMLTIRATNGSVAFFKVWLQSLSYPLLYPTLNL